MELNVLKFQNYTPNISLTKYHNKNLSLRLTKVTKLASCLPCQWTMLSHRLLLFLFSFSMCFFAYYQCFWFTCNWNAPMDLIKFSLENIFSYFLHVSPSKNIFFSISLYWLLLNKWTKRVNYSFIRLVSPIKKFIEA